MSVKKENLDELLVSLETSQNLQMQLYLVCRNLKPEFKASAKVLDKYDFSLLRVDLSNDLNSFFANIVKTQLSFAINKPDLEMCNYSIIDDDLGNKIYTYALNNALSFSKIITSDLSQPTAIKSLLSLEEIKDDLWAYCIKTTLDNEQSFFSFRKSSKGKVSIDKEAGILNKISAMFDSSDAELKVFHQNTINFDNKIDCIFFENEFYVFKKSNFELIAGLEEEYKEQANAIIENLEGTNLIEGISELKDEILERKSLLKTLISISKKGNDCSFDSNEIDKMKKVLKQMEGKDLKISKEGKVQIADIKDLNNFVKLLNDYYNVMPQ